MSRAGLEEGNWERAQAKKRVPAKGISKEKVVEGRRE